MIVLSEIEVCSGGPEKWNGGSSGRTMALQAGDNRGTGSIVSSNTTALRYKV